MDSWGQGGSERLLPEAPLKAHIHDFEEYDADLDAFMDQMVLPKLGVQAADSGLPIPWGAQSCPLSSSPWRPFRGLRSLRAHGDVFHARPAALAGASADQCDGSGRSCYRFRLGHEAGRDPLTKATFEEQIVTTDRARFQRTQDVLKKWPGTKSGGADLGLGWLRPIGPSAAYLAARPYGEQIGTPVLVCGAGHDRICGTTEARPLRAARYAPRPVSSEIAACEP